VESLLLLQLNYYHSTLHIIRRSLLVKIYETDEGETRWVFSDKQAILLPPKCHLTIGFLPKIGHRLELSQEVTFLFFNYYVCLCWLKHKSPAQAHGTSVMWHVSLPLINSFNKTETGFLFFFSLAEKKLIHNAKKQKTSSLSYFPYLHLIHDTCA